MSVPHDRNNDPKKYKSDDYKKAVLYYNSFMQKFLRLKNEHFLPLLFVKLIVMPIRF